MNTGSWLSEEDINGLSGNFFDDLINHIDLPLEDIETTNDDEDWDAGFQDLVPPLDVLTSFSSEFSRPTTCKRQLLGVQKPIPVSKQKSSSTVDSSLPDVKVSRLFKSSSPVSVLANANGSVLFQDLNRALKLAFPVKGIRSKRKRPTTLRFRVLKSFLSGMLKQFTLDESESKKSAKKKLKNHSAHSVSNTTEPFKADGIVRKCTHCETIKTPQWREGPNGPKTLCNACGVRFRSGRLVPEYRPASSPTFIPTVHSNLHRKIIEMKRKGEDQFDTKMVHAVTSKG